MSWAAQVLFDLPQSRLRRPPATFRAPTTARHPATPSNADDSCFAGLRLIGYRMGAFGELGRSRICPWLFGNGQSWIVWSAGGLGYHLPANTSTISVVRAAMKAAAANSSLGAASMYFSTWWCSSSGGSWLIFFRLGTVMWTP